MRWPWQQHSVLDELIIAQNRRISELERQVADHDLNFARLEVRLSGEKIITPPVELGRDTDWMERRKELTERYAQKRESSAKRSAVA